MPTRVSSGPVAADQRADRLDGHVRGQQEELDRDELLRARLGSLREDPRAGEAPDDDDAREALDRGVQTEADQRDGTGGQAGEDRYGTLDGHPREAEPRQEPSPAGEPQVAVHGGRGRDRELERGHSAQV
jgi:hypothetical protein